MRLILSEFVHAVLAAVVAVSATPYGDEAFYGQSPPVYPSRKALTTTTSNTCILVHWRSQDTG